MSGYVLDTESNSHRALRATVCIAAYKSITGTDEENVVGDIMTDLMHWCDQHNVSFVRAAEYASFSYKDEA